MAKEQDLLDARDLLDPEELEILEEIARSTGMTIGQVAQEGIQEIITERTRPRLMNGPLQAFRRSRK